MYKEDLALDNQRKLIRHKTQPNQNQANYSLLYYLFIAGGGRADGLIFFQ